MWASRWSLRFTIVVIGLYLLWYVMGLLWVIVLPVQRVRELVSACPYPPDDAGTHTYITLTSDEDLLRELFDAGAAAGAEQSSLGPEATAWLAPKGGTLDSPLSKLGAKARYKSTTTTRNLRTMLKVLEAAGA